MPVIRRRTTAPVWTGVVRTALTIALLLGPLSTSARASADLEGCFLAGINSQRAAAGAGSLAASGTLTAYGRAHSEAMAAAGDIYHSTHGELAPYLPAGSVSWGENVGTASDSATCQPLLNAFLASPNHRANLLDPAFDVAGIGVFVDAGGAMWTTHVFVAIDAPATTTTTTTTIAAPTATTTTTVPSTTSTVTTPTTTTAPAPTASTLPPAVAPSSTTLPHVMLTDDESTTTTVAATANTPSPTQEVSPTTMSAGALPPPASSAGEGRATAPASRVAPAGDVAMVTAPNAPKGSGCRGGSCLGFVLATVGLAGLAVGAMARWAVRR